MNKTIGFQMAAYSLLLAGLSYLAYYLAPAIGRNTLILGLAGGAFCLVWSLRAISGSRGKALSILTLIPVCFMLMPQVFSSWSDANLQVAGGRAAAMVTTVLFVLSLGMLVRIAWAGVVFDVQPNSLPQDGKPAAQANAGKAQRV